MNRELLDSGVLADTPRAVSPAAPAAFKKSRRFIAIDLHPDYDRARKIGTDGTFRDTIGLVLDYLQTWLDWLNRPLLRLGDAQITGLGILMLLVAPILVIVLAGLLRKLLTRLLKKQGRIDSGVRNAIVSLSYYSFLVLGMAVTLDSAGFDMTSLAVFSGGLGIGLGIGLQDVARNFISGIVLLVARPVRPGDRIEFEGLEGNVEQIGTYSTRIQTVQDATVIVPNSKLTDSQIINWTHNAARRMLFVPVGVHYDSDLDLVQKLMLEAAERSPDIADRPAPEVFLKQFGDSSIDFEIAIWTETQVFRPRRLLSQYNVQIVKLFQENGVVIPYPQRDVHLIPDPKASLE